MIDPSRLDVVLHLSAALAAGGAIGMERSWHGRDAGFRTHALVCVASSALMLLTVYQSRWFPGGSDGIRMDPTRMAQGIMTGIGFLGAGVIFKEGLSVRGLTTSASIWITAAIGVLMGSGLYFPGIATTVVTLGVLEVFRVIEQHMPVHRYAHHRLRFDRGSVLPEPEVRAMMAQHGLEVTGLSYRTTDAGQTFEYRMTIKSTDPASFGRLAATLQHRAEVREFHLSPGD